MQFIKIFALVSFLAGAHAHFLLNYPPTRGFDEDQEPNFCGGFPLAPNRSLFPLTSGIVSITSEHPKAEIDILISFDSNPTSFANFNQTASGTSIPLLLNFTQMDAQGNACFPVNVSALGVPDAKNGANATIQVQFNGGDGELFQCADVMLSSSFTVPSGTLCQNATGAFPSSSGTKSSDASTLTSAFTSTFTAGVLGAFVGVYLTF